MRITLHIDYDDMEVSAQRLADNLLEVPGVEGVEVGEWTA